MYIFKRFNEFKVEKCDFEFLIFLLNFIKMAKFKSGKAGLSGGEGISFVDQILSALEELKVRLPFF